MERVDALKGIVDNIIAPLLAKRRNIGVVAGVIDRGQNLVQGYGQARDDRAGSPDAETVFEIGSVTKVFTSTLLAILATEGLLDLNQPVRDLLPELSHLSPEVTPLSLATHTSGLPRLPGNFYAQMFRNMRNPYANYTTGDMLAFLARYRPRPKRRAESQPGVSYSNLGGGLLGYLLARRAGVSYEDAVVSRICDPLDLADTRVTLTSDQQARLATPHSPRGKPASNWDIPSLAGAGALRSTAKDMLKFLAAQLDQSPHDLTSALADCHNLRVRLPPPPTSGLLGKIASRLERRISASPIAPVGVGLGWFLVKLGDSGAIAHMHNGATGGYRAFAGFVKESETAVVVMANRGLSEYDLVFRAKSVDDIGLDILRRLERSRSDRHSASAGRPSTC